MFLESKSRVSGSRPEEQGTGYLCSVFVCWGTWRAHIEISRETSSCFHAKIILRLQILTRDSTTVARSATAVIVSSLSWQSVSDKKQEIRPALSSVLSALKPHVIYFSISENSWHLQRLSLKPRDCSSPWRVCCLGAKKRKAKGELRPALTCCHTAAPVNLRPIA